jgi:hypothetical protein
MKNNNELRKGLHMRFLMTIAFLCAGLAQGQQPSGAPCGEQGQGFFSQSYYEGVLHTIRPPDWNHSLISISFFIKGETKLVLRTDGKTFELLRGRPEHAIVFSLEAADRLCMLPLDPVKALDLVQINWEQVAISRSTFDQLHREFTAALGKHMSGVQGQYAELLKTRQVMVHLHTPEYSVLYDNGDERIEVRAIDSTDDPTKKDPVVTWVQAILKIADNNLHEKDVTNSGK